MILGYWVLSGHVYAFAIDQLYSWVLGFRKSSALRGLLICRTLSTPVMILGYWVLSGHVYSFAIDQLYSWILGFRKHMCAFAVD